MKILSLRARQKIQPRGSKVEKLPEAIPEFSYSEAMIMELKYCAMDPQYFINRYVLKSPLYASQSRFLEYVQEFNGVVCKHPRRAGMTTVSMAYLLWQAMFQQHKVIVGLMPKHVMAVDCARIVRDMYEQLPSWLKAGLRYSNRTDMEFDNGSIIRFGVVTENACRGLSISTLYLGDLALADPLHAELMWQCVAPCLMAVGSKIICHSSPTDQFHLFSDLYKDACDKKHGWAGLGIEYWDVPTSTYDDFLRLQQVMSAADFRREYMCEFVT